MNIIQDFEYGFSRETEINYLIMQLNFFKNGGYNQFINFREITNNQNAFIPRIEGYDYGDYEFAVRYCIRSNETYRHVVDDKFETIHYPIKFTEDTYDDLRSGKLFSRIMQEDLMKDFFNSKEYIDGLSDAVKEGIISVDTLLSSVHIRYRLNFTPDDLRKLGIKDINYDYLDSIESVLNNIDDVKRLLEDHKEREINGIISHSREEYNIMRVLVNTLRVDLGKVMKNCIECEEKFGYDKDEVVKAFKNLEIPDEPVL
nr:MAG TPA: hypothetical protein [Caudoviricetes sp.]